MFIVRMYYDRNIIELSEVADLLMIVPFILIGVRFLRAGKVDDDKGAAFGVAIKVGNIL